MMSYGKKMLEAALNKPKRESNRKTPSPFSSSLVRTQHRRQPQDNSNPPNQEDKGPPDKMTQLPGPPG